MKLGSKAVILIFSVIFCSFIIASCSKGVEETKVTYTHISAEEAKELMDSEKDYIILDVRTQEEFKQGHIKDAVLIPDYEISERAKSELPDKKQLILVYCRSGNRSKSASSELAAMGYSNVKEFGGIIDWPYDIEKN